MSVTRIITALSAALVACVVLAGAAAAQYPPATTGVAQLSATVVSPGEGVTFAATGFRAGAPVTVTENGALVRTLRADARGTFATRIALRAAGAHLLSASGPTATGLIRVVSATVTVEGTAAGRPLPRTGAVSTLRSLLIGLGAVTSGSLIVFLSRRRRRSHRLAPA